MTPEPMTKQPRIDVPSNAPIQTIRVSPYGPWVVAGNTEREVFICSGQHLVHKLNVRSSNIKFWSMERIRDLNFTPDGQCLLLTCGDTAYVIELETGHIMWTAKTHKLFAFLGILSTGIAASQIGTIAISFDNGNFEVRHLNGVVARRFNDNSGPRWMAITPDGTHIIGSDGFSIFEWDTNSGHRVMQYKISERIYGFRASNSAQHFVVRTLHGYSLYQRGKEDCVCEIESGLGLPIICFSQTEELIGVGETNGVRIIDVAGNTVAHTRSNGSRILCADFASSSSEDILIGCSDGTISVAQHGKPSEVLDEIREHDLGQ